MKPKYSDVKEMPDIEFQKMVDKEAETRNLKTYGRDGLHTVWEKTYAYRRIKYDIILLRYYQIGIPVNETTGWNQYQKHFVLEHPQESKPFVDMALDDEFLYDDTIHSWNENQTLEEMFYEMSDKAKSDIDELLDNVPSEKEKQAEILKGEVKTLRFYAKKYPKVD